MVADFVAKFARMISLYPDDVRVQERIENTQYGEVTQITLYANRADIGKLIGKEGKMIGAIKTVISGCKAKDAKNYRINVESIEGK